MRTAKIITGSGIGPTSARPTHEYDAGKSKTVLAFVITYASPVRTVAIPIVTIRGLTLSANTSLPLINPKKGPTQIAVKKPRSVF